jgi:surfactin synthase thioesterase subunit/SAM-dependent methyltransferase
MAEATSLATRNRAAYARLDALLAQDRRAQDHAAFLNWGYRSLPGVADWAARPTEAGMVNADHIRLVREVIGPEPLDGCDLLDLGCGRGGSLMVLEQDWRLRRLIGADLSPANLAACRRLLERVPQRARSRRLQPVDASALPYPDASLDVVLNIESSGAYADQAAFLAEVARVLRPGGRLLFADLLPAELATALQEAAGALGLACLRARAITANVLAARAASAAVEARLFAPAAVAAVDRDGVLAGLLDQLRAGPGSAMDAQLRAGRLGYHILQFRKEAGGAPALPDRLAAPLQARQGRIAALLADHLPATDEAAAWLPHYRAAPGAAMQLFCLPFAGGSAAYYRAWRRHLPAGIELCAIELPGRGTRLGEPPAADAVGLAAAMADALRPAIRERFALFGHSLGALLGYLLAQALRARHGLAPAHLFVSGRHAPHRPGLRPHRHGLEDAALAAELEGLGGMAPEILASPELMALLLPILRADFRLTELHAEPAGTPPLAVPMTALVGAADEEVPVGEMAAWREVAGAGFELAVLPGGHFYLSDEAARAVLLRRIVRTLAPEDGQDAAAG